MAGWHDTIDTMLSLKHWWETPAGIKYGDGFIRSVARLQPQQTHGHEDERGWLSSAARMQIDKAEPFFVSNEVFEMVDGAAATFKGEAFQRTDLITPSGFVLLPKPFFSKDRHGKIIQYASILVGTLCLIGMARCARDR